MSPGKRRRGDNGESFPVFTEQREKNNSDQFCEQSKRGFQAKNGKKSVPAQNSMEPRKVFRSNNTKVVRGTATTTTSATAGGVERRAGWGSSPRDLFVYHTAHDTTDQDIRDAAKHFGDIVVKNVERRSNENAYYGSFRVTIDRNDFDKAMSPSSWPAGWSLRQYFVSRNRVVNNSQKTSPVQSPVAEAVNVPN